MSTISCALKKKSYLHHQFSVNKRDKVYQIHIQNSLSSFDLRRDV